MWANNWTIDPSPMGCPPTPGPNDNASISGTVDSHPYVINIKGLTQSGTFLCRAQFLSINGGEINSFGSPFEPTEFRMIDGSIINLIKTDSSSATMNIGSFATLDIRNGVIRPINPGEGQLVTVGGTLTKTADPGAYSAIDAPIANDGFITVESGTLFLNGGGTSDGLIAPAADTTLRLQGNFTDIGGEVAGEGTVWFSGGVYTITGDYHPKHTIIAYGSGGAIVSFDADNTVDNLTIANSGHLGGTGELTIKHLAWHGSPASMLPGGTTIVTHTALFQGQSNNHASDLYRDLELHGESTLTAGSDIRMDSAELRNYGTFTADGNNNISQFCCVLNSSFKNFGQMHFGGNCTVSTLLSNLGTINVHGGTLTLGADMASAGPIVVDAGATLLMSLGQQSLFPSATVSGEGTVRFAPWYFDPVIDVVEGALEVPVVIIDAGYVQFPNDHSFQTLNVNGGQVLGDGDLEVNGQLNWSNGEMTGDGVMRVRGGTLFSGYAQLNRVLELDNVGSPLVAGTGGLQVSETAPGVVRGSGVVGGSLHNRGTVSPGVPAAPIGTISVASDYGISCCWSTTELLIDVDGPAHDSLEVAGTASINGRLVISGNYTPGASYTILTAGSVQGGFSPVIAPQGTQIQYTPTAVIAHMPFGPTMLVNFDVYPNGAAVQGGDVFTDQWASVGVVLSDGRDGGPGPSGNHCSISPPNHAAAGGLIVATFVDPCTGAPSATDAVSVQQDWCWAGGEGLDVYAYDLKGNEIGHQFVQGGGVAASFDFNQQIIARLDIFHIGQGIDNLSFTLPASVADDCPADANHDNAINVDDLLTVINDWGACGLGICAGDSNCDAVVNVDDLLEVINAWGPCP